tara:strand:- start:8610 stop:12293 length:3684 start_codon:yes stop_codon:yes gene_type:complete
MKLIQTKTLESIAHHKNKIVRLASYLLESESDYIIQKMGEVKPESNITDVVSAINQDLATTAKFVNSLSKTIQTVDENDVSIELDNGETNFQTIFPNHYKNGEISIFGVTLSRKNGAGYLKPDDIKKKIFQNAFPAHKFDDFKALVKLVNKAISQAGVTLDMPFEDRLSKAATIQAVDGFRPFIGDVLDSAEVNFKVRMQMSDQAKKIVDQKVMGGRAMIDGVTLSSTHIRKSDGIVQVAPAHKKQHKLLNDIKGMVDSLPYLKGVEIDYESDLQKFHDMVESLRNMRFSNSEPFELKSRKLGNYGASGINVVTSDGQEMIEEQFGYANNMLRIVAVDVRTPTSLAHEIAHYSDTALNSSHMIRSSIVQHFGGKINRELLRDMYGDKTANYLSNDREVVARLGEIGFALHQIGFESGDTVNNVVEKARKWESDGIDASGEKKFNVAIVKTVEEYMAIENYKGDSYREESYFHMADWTSDELSMVRDFTQGFYFDMQPEVQEALEARLKTHQAKLTTLNKMEVKRARTRRVRALSAQDIRQKVWGVLKQEPDVLANILEVGKRENLFEDGEFSYYATMDLSTVFAGSSRKRSLDRNLISLQYKGYENLAQHAAENGYVSELSIIQFGAGSMAMSVSEAKRPATSHPEMEFLIKKINASYSPEEQDNGFKGLLGLRTTGWGSLSSETGFGEAWRGHIKGAYEKASEGIKQHSMGANLQSSYPMAQAAFLASCLVEAGGKLEALPPELAFVVQEDAFNMGVIAFSDKDKLAHRFDELAASSLHQELFDTGNFMFKLGDNHLESVLASQMLSDGFAESLGLTEQQLKDAILSPEIQNSVSIQMHQKESPGDYLTRLEGHYFDRPDGENYHERYSRTNEVVSNKSRSYGDMQSDSIRTSPLIVLSYLAQKAKGVEGISKFINSTAKALESSSRFKEMTDDIANANIAHFNFAQMKFRDGASYGFGKKIGTPESVIIENMTMKGVRPHKDSKVLEYKPTETFRDMLKVKLISDYISIGNPDKPEPMAVRALKASNSNIERRPAVRMIPVGVTSDYHLASSTVVTMAAINSIVGSVASKVNTPEYEKEILTGRNMGREYGIEFQKLIDNLEGALGSDAYKAFEFSQRSDLSQMPLSPSAPALNNLWLHMTNNLIQYHQDAFTSIPEMIEAKEQDFKLQLDAQRVRERVLEIELSKASKNEVEDIKVEDKVEVEVKIKDEPTKPISQTPQQMKMF